ncbi:MAG: hypothetical protein OEW92_05625, partial [Gammaproteobacteria bacterium]|nr:hypothetical protein [Gammaproteobacteria bacterium]
SRVLPRATEPDVLLPDPREASSMNTVFFTGNRGSLRASTGMGLPPDELSRFHATWFCKNIVISAALVHIQYCLPCVAGKFIGLELKD